jgi:glycine/D-amino acid oxidase-like deaminating enzyme
VTAGPPARSLWAATAIAGPAPLPLQGELLKDVAIVGGGFTGLSAALHLAAGGTRVALVEAGEIGHGASGRNGGQVIAGLKLDPEDLVARLGPEKGERLAAFAGGAADLVFDLVARHGIACDAQRSGWIQAAHAPAAMSVLEARVRQWTARGHAMELLSAEQVRGLVGSPRYVGGLVDRHSGQLQPLSYVRGLAAAAQRAGAVLHARSPATRLERDGRGWRVATPGGAVRAPMVILATNAYTESLWPGLARSVIPVWSYQIATAPLDAEQRRAVLPGGMPVSDTRRLLLYFRLDRDGRLVVGGRGPFRDGTPPRDYAKIVDGLRWLFPDLATPAIEHFWSGRVALTLDHLPHLHELAPGLRACLGYNGRGVALATACGKLLADWAQGRAAAALPLPLAPLRPIPLHALRRPALSAAIAWKRLLDRWEARQST